MVESRGHYFVAVDINDSQRLLGVDTSAERTILSADTADALNLPADTSKAENLVNVGERMKPVYPRVVASLKLGPAEWSNLTVPTVESLLPSPHTPTPVAGVLGANILSRYDVELDFPAGTMTLYSAQNCAGRFAPWHGDYQAYSPEYTKRHRFIVSVALNGHPMRAVLDTGATHSLVSRAAALDAGVDEAELARDRTVSGTGLNGNSIGVHIHRFEQFRVGSRAYDNIVLEVGDTQLSTDMLLGMDFMKWRRVWLSYSTGWVFTQLASLRADGGLVEPHSVSGPGRALDAGAELAAIPHAASTPDALPLDRLREFSSHSHITYYRSQRLIEAPRMPSGGYKPGDTFP
nr:retroviral-like aspartic protease family protein [Paraburkholderia sp. Tr-20389]